MNYAVRQFPGYGKLSGRSLDDLRAGERVALNSAKLEENGLAYQSEDGDVNYAVRQFPGYGKSSKERPDNLP
ncbi:cysteinyl-tRNA ligase [Alcaligenes faecalis subsp. faecalis NCIB 8687]|nr:cysteinyl-tRNA ligase [Alcaligenes faecalis subsp. faecalis NCIB 8687]